MPTLNPTQIACIKSSCTPVQIFGGALHLDLQSQRMVSYLFDDRKSKVMLFVAKGQEEEQALEYVLPLAKQHLETLKFVFANPSTTEVRCAPSQLLRNDFADGLSYFDASVGRVVGCMSAVTVDACLPLRWMHVCRYGGCMSTVTVDACLPLRWMHVCRYGGCMSSSN